MIQYKKRYSMIFNETTIPQNTWMLAIIGKAKAVENEKNTYRTVGYKIPGQIQCAIIRKKKKTNGLFYDKIIEEIVI